ncbi:vomeronasal type-1 receptor 1-like [Castor canadensis]|uniref:Vomeronasal type-1 receptor 1-like n=1 Tax=Castor canadensis TaxID=51338 RepID=A0AC58LIE2_CASCN
MASWGMSSESSPHCYQWHWMPAVYPDPCSLPVTSADEASVNLVQMAVVDVVPKVVFLLQVGAGILGNAFLFSIHSPIFLTRHRLKPVDLILSNLAMANSFVLFSKGVQGVMEDLGLAHALGDSGCQVLFFFHRVSRDLSLCTTCLLSCLQAVTISPMSAVWAVLRDRVSKNVDSSCILCWILNLAVNIISPIQIRVYWENSSSSRTGNQIICQYEVSRSGRWSIPLSFPGALLMTLTFVASMHMVCLLRRHHQRVQHVHSPSLTLRTSPEIRATHSILLLVASFIPFYFLNSIYIFYGTKSFSSYLWLQHTLKFLATCFPSLSPLVLVLQNSRALGSCF